MSDVYVNHISTIVEGTKSLKRHLIPGGGRPDDAINIYSYKGKQRYVFSFGFDRSVLSA